MLGQCCLDGGRFVGDGKKCQGPRIGLHRGEEVEAHSYTCGQNGFFIIGGEILIVPRLYCGCLETLNHKLISILFFIYKMYYVFEKMTNYEQFYISDILHGTALRATPERTPHIVSRTHVYPYHCTWVLPTLGSRSSSSQFTVQ